MWWHWDGEWWLFLEDVVAGEMASLVRELLVWTLPPEYHVTSEYPGALCTFQDVQAPGKGEEEDAAPLSKLIVPPGKTAPQKRSLEPGRLFRSSRKSCARRQAGCRWIETATWHGPHPPTWEGWEAERRAPSMPLSSERFCFAAALEEAF